jgi:hypothetical protein
LRCTLFKDFSQTKIRSSACCSNINNPDGSDSPELSICRGDDDRVKIWNSDELDISIEFDLSDGEPVAAVDWSTG